MNEIFHTLAYVGVALSGVIFFWILFDRLATPGISLWDTLFKKDNWPAGLEVGGIILAIMYLMREVMVGGSTAQVSFGMDLWHTAIEVVIFAVVFCLGRMLLSAVIKPMNHYKEEDDLVELNDEIYNEKNWAASLTSLAWIVVLANSISFLDFFGGQFLQSFIMASFTLVVGTLLMLVGYGLICLPKGRPYYELFIKNNPAVGISLLGCVFAFNVMIDMAGVGLAKEFTLLNLAVTGAWLLGAMVFSAIVMALFNQLFRLVHSNSLSDELIAGSNEGSNHGNVGAALLQSGFLIGLMMLIGTVAFGS